MKTTLTLQQSGPFAQNPRFAEIEWSKILCDDAFFPASIDPAKQYNPHNVRCWVIGHEFGAICAVFASGEQNALDAACDKGLIDCLMAEEQNQEDDSLTPLGNASELFDLSHSWVAPVEWNPKEHIGLIVAIVRAHESGEDFAE